MLGEKYIENLDKKFEYLFKGEFPGAMVQEGWKSLLDSLLDELITLDYDRQAIVLQIKEKFGGLRFYVNSASDQIYELISKYEEQSYKICEVCGNPGHQCFTTTWTRTLCDEHERKNKWYTKEMLNTV